MNETMILLTLGDLTVTVWSLLLAVAAGAAVALICLLGRKTIGLDASLSLSLAVMLGAVLGGRAVYCLTMMEFILYDLGGAGYIPQLWQGGFTLWGAVLGGAVGAWLYGHATGRKLGELLNLLAPGAALVLMAARFGEAFTSQGLGDYLEDEMMMHFPLGVESAYGDWQVPVFFYEGLAAAVLLMVTLLAWRKKSGGAELFAVLLALSQILLESLREDEFIRFGFVRFNQLGAALLLGGVLALRLAREVRANGWCTWQKVRIALFALGIGLVIAIEFALDKSTINNVLLYAVMAATLVMMGFALLRSGRKTATGKE